MCIGKEVNERIYHSIRRRRKKRAFWGNNHSMLYVDISRRCFSVLIINEGHQKWAALIHWQLQWDWRWWWWFDIVCFIYLKRFDVAIWCSWPHFELSIGHKNMTALSIMNLTFQRQFSFLYFTVWIFCLVQIIEILVGNSHRPNVNSSLINGSVVRFISSALCLLFLRFTSQ